MIEWAIIRMAHIPGFKSMARTTVTIADKLTLKIMMMFDRILKRSDMSLYTCPKTNYSTTRVIHYPAYTGPNRGQTNENPRTQ